MPTSNDRTKLKICIFHLSIILIISLLFFKDYLLFNKLPITAADPAYIFWTNVINAKYIKLGIVPLWDSISGLGRSVFANDIWGSVFCAGPLFMSLFVNAITGYVLFLWLEFVLFGILTIYYLEKWCRLDFTSALISFVILIYCPAFLNEYFFNSFGGFLLIPLMLEMVEQYLRQRSFTFAVWLGCILALSNWLSNSSVPQFSAIFVAIFIIYRIWNKNEYFKSIVSALSFMIIAGFVYMGLMAFYILPLLIESASSYRSHISSLGAGYSIKDIALWLLFPFTSGLFMDEMMIPTGLLTYMESLSGYVHILLLPSIILFFLNRRSFNRREGFFFYYPVGYILLGWLNNYVPILDHLQAITKATGWWRSFPLFILSGAFCTGIVVEKLGRDEIRWDNKLLNKIARAAFKLLSVGYSAAFIGFIMIVLISSVNSDLLFHFLSKFTVRSLQNLQSYFENYYFVWPRVLYIALVPATLALILTLFTKQFEVNSNNNRGKLIQKWFFFVIILIGQYALTQIYYPFNSGIHKTIKIKEAALFRKLDNESRIGIVLNRLRDIENKVREDIGYKDKNANLGLYLAMQGYPEVTRFQSNITMDGNFISSLGPSVYARGSNFTPKRLVVYHNQLIKDGAYVKERFKKIKAYLHLSRSSIDSKLLDIAGINYLLSSLPLSNQKLELILNGNVYKVYHNNRAVPKFYFASSVKTINEKKHILEVLESNKFIPGIDAIVEKQLNISPSAGFNRTVRVIKSMPGEINLLVENSSPSFLVINESFHSGWKAHDNSKAIELLRTNYLFMGLLLKPGNHNIKLTFNPPGFRFGAVISSLIFALATFFSIKHIYIKRKESNTKHN